MKQFSKHYNKLKPSILYPKNKQTRYCLTVFSSFNYTLKAQHSEFIQPFDRVVFLQPKEIMYVNQATKSQFS